MRLHNSSKTKRQPGVVVGRNTPPQVLQLFALMLREGAQSMAQGRPLRLKPGHFVLLLLNRPEFDELSTLGGGGKRRWKLTASLEMLERQFSGDAAAPALMLGLHRAADFGVTTGAELCRLMIAVLQTLQPIRNEALRAWNQRLADEALGLPPSPDKKPEPLPSPPKPREPWWEVALRLKGRPDEGGQSVRAGGVSLWHASHRGTPDKKLNQDATFARTAGGRLCFALTDGVTTSLGSREAAAVAAAAFCENLVMQMEAAVAIPEFASALSAARSALCQLRDEMEKDFGTSKFKHVFAEVQHETAEYLFRESRKGHPRRPILACTLIGGVISPRGTGASVDLVRLGDGVAEKVGADGKVYSLLSMDREEMGISKYLGPDKRSEEAHAEATVADLETAEWLLMSSDGLVRGHTSSTVWGAITEILERTPADCMFDRSPESAWRMLETLYDRVRREKRMDGLFADNWSVVVARITGGER